MVFVRRGGNKVAHELFHWQPICFEGRVWTDDVLDNVECRASDDLVALVDSILI